MKKVNKIAIFALVLAFGLISVMPAAEARGPVSQNSFNGKPNLVKPLKPQTSTEEPAVEGIYAVNYGSITLNVQGQSYTVTMDELRAGYEFGNDHYIDPAVVKIMENYLPAEFTLREVKKHGRLSKVEMQLEQGSLFGILDHGQNRVLVGRAGAAGSGSCALIGAVLSGGKLKAGANGTEINNGATSFGVVLGCDGEAIYGTLAFNWTAAAAQEETEPAQVDAGLIKTTIPSGIQSR